MSLPTSDPAIDEVIGIMLDAKNMIMELPKSRPTSIAMTHLETAMLWLMAVEITNQPTFTKEKPADVVPQKLEATPEPNSGPTA